ncbi:diacylglycerol/lipid kinase family protein [Halopelagius fulvigenes]|uniref:Diacylglycerol/lipid kinase family protein n=1 Tax=Halopelagius fulvigenes TaxID=1198324 RepID=A0ABD5TV61_9EURY
MSRRVLVRNPESGDGRQSERARDVAESRGYDLRNSADGDEARTLARDAAAAGATTIVACGGDGTLNRVVRGVDEAGKLDDVRLGVVPAGTGNDFADNVGIRDVEHAFEVVESGEERRIDLGSVRWTDGSSGGDSGAASNLFLNSCVCGLTAEASARTTPEAKRRFGVLAYVLSTLQRTRSFEGLELDVRAGSDREPAWSGQALMLLVGNGRRFPGEGMQQANMEDGLLNVVVVEHAPALDYLTSGAADALLRRDASHLTRLKVPRLVVDAATPRQFSLDGEMVEERHLVADCRPGAMRFAVGETYDPSPSDPDAE